MTLKNPPNALGLHAHRRDLIYNVLKLHQISSSGMTIILGKKSAKIQILHVLAYLALFSYLKFRGFTDKISESLGS